MDEKTINYRISIKQKLIDTLLKDIVKLLTEIANLEAMKNDKKRNDSRGNISG